MLHIDVKFINLISSRLENFKQLADSKYQFRCPFCGDSKRNKLKSRGFIYRKENAMFFNCFNCNHSTTLGNLIKQVSPLDYDDYVVERYKSSTNKFAPHAKPEFVYESPKFEPKPISLLDKLLPVTESRAALSYCLKRKIPDDKIPLLYYSDSFFKFINTIVPNKFKISKTDSPRLVIPCYNRDKQIVQLTGRALDDNTMRYAHVSLVDEPKTFGVERLDFSKRIFAVEGQIDSLFIDNCVAMGSSAFDTKFTRDNKDNITLVYDNEPRSPQITKLIEKSIKAGFDICVWDSMIDGKDINEMVLNGVNAQKVISENTFTGAEALMRFIAWKKC